MLTSSIIEAFARQIAVDPTRASRYLQCLQEIGHLRGGEDALAIGRAVETAYADHNLYTQVDVADAYRYFGLSGDDSRLTEDSIIGTFYNYLSSTPQEMETRRQLWRIGDSRNSERIRSAAEDSKNAFFWSLCVRCSLAQELLHLNRLKFSSASAMTPPMTLSWQCSLRRYVNIN